MPIIADNRLAKRCHYYIKLIRYTVINLRNRTAEQGPRTGRVISVRYLARTDLLHGDHEHGLVFFRLIHMMSILLVHVIKGFSKKP